MNETLIIKNLIKNMFESDVVQEALDVFIPTFLTSPESEEQLVAAKGIAEAFEISHVFNAILSDESGSLEKKAIMSWGQNVHLLIDKTWVEQTEELFKMETSRAIDKMTLAFLTFLDKKHEMYSPNFEAFCTLLRDTVYLLFGKEARLDSLVEYVLRMEPHFGLFCYYLSQLKEIKTMTEYKARLAILLAIVFLAEF